MPLRIYLLRHGETTFSRAEDFCGSGTDADLTAAGRAMAEAFAARYGAFNWTAIYASPMKRAQLTAQPTATAAHIAIVTKAGLNEIAYGSWEGKSHREVEAAEPELFQAWTDCPDTVSPPEGETATQVARRARAVFDEVVSTFSDGNVLFVTHKATIRVLLCDLLGINLRHYRHLLDCPVASVTVIELHDGMPMLKLLGDRSHLPEGNQFR